MLSFQLYEGKCLVLLIGRSKLAHALSSVGKKPSKAKLKTNHVYSYYLCFNFWIESYVFQNIYHILQRDLANIMHLRLTRPGCKQLCTQSFLNAVCLGQLVLDDDLQLSSLCSPYERLILASLKQR